MKHKLNNKQIPPLELPECTAQTDLNGTTMWETSINNEKKEEKNTIQLMMWAHTIEWSSREESTHKTAPTQQTKLRKSNRAKAISLRQPVGRITEWPSTSLRFAYYTHCIYIIRILCFYPNNRKIHVEIFKIRPKRAWCGRRTRHTVDTIFIYRLYRCNIMYYTYICSKRVLLLLRGSVALVSPLLNVSWLVDYVCGERHRAFAKSKERRPREWNRFQIRASIRFFHQSKKKSLCE